MPRYSFMIVALLMAISSNAMAEIKIPKPLIIELIDKHCSSPNPNPRVNPVLEYDCSDAYEDADGEAQSMNYSLRLLPLIAKDFNQDGIEDLAVEVESMGPLSGSVYTNSAVHYLLLNKNKKIIKEHQILLYAPFSEHIVEYNLEGLRMYYSAIPNYRAHPESYEDGELLEPVIEFEVNWVDGAPVSTYYQDNCRLSDVDDKRIFTANPEVERSIDIDMHEYTQVIEEAITLKNIKVSAQLSGCDNKDLSFYVEANPNQNLPVLADVLEQLIAITNDSKPLKSLLERDQNYELVFGELMTLDEGWSARIFIDRSVDNASIRINLVQSE